LSLLQPEDVVRDTYTVERQLGEGAFAEVYRVKHRFMGRQAMKVFKASAPSLKRIEDDLKEATLLSSMKHSNLVEVYDANVVMIRSAEHGYFTMNYMPGGTLERYWRSFVHRMVPVKDCVDIILQAARGLAVAHAQTPPIIHRDIKPPNILISFGLERINARLSDFGLAKAANPLTLQVDAGGTIDFKPPEAFDNEDSCAADIWALGTTLYLILTDKLPFPPSSSEDARDRGRFHRPLRPPSFYNADVNDPLEAILYRCLAHKPADRYQSATELLHDLERWSPNFLTRGSSLSRCSFSSKDAIAERSKHDLQSEARQALREAERLSQNPSQLTSAADLLEEAISKDPMLDPYYREILELWRKGVMVPFRPRPHQSGA
jgi:eukaryotic-like serine/threonine-protein kinase